MSRPIDHLVYGTRDLEGSVAGIADLLSVEIPYRGQHPGIGTHNAIVPLREGVYLEIIAPDPDNPPPPGQPLPFHLDRLAAPQLTALDAELAIKAGPSRDFVAVIDCPRGRVELR